MMAVLARWLIVTLLLMESTILALQITKGKFQRVMPPKLKPESKSAVKVEVVTSAILSFAPWLELHHIVVFKAPKLKGAYTIDFSPLNYQDPNTLGKMLLGKYVEGELRARYIPEDKLSIDEIKHKCMEADASFFDKPLPKVSDSYRSLEIEAFMHYIKENWKGRINVYEHNCQHFSKYVVQAAQSQLNVI